MPHMETKIPDEYWHLCPKNLYGGLASALIHLRARLDGLPVTSQFVNPPPRLLLCPPEHATIFLMSEYAEDIEEEAYPFSEYALESRPPERVIYYDNLPDLADRLHLAQHIAAHDLAVVESVPTLTNQSILLSRLYNQLAHDDFAAYIAHRLFTQPHYGYRILQDEEALRALFEADEMIFHPEVAHADLP